MAKPDTQKDQQAEKVAQSQQEQGQEQVQAPTEETPVAAFSIPVYGTGSKPMSFNFRAPTAKAIEAAKANGEPLPIKRDSVKIDAMMPTFQDVLAWARTLATDPADKIAEQRLTWLATLACEDIQGAIKAAFDDQPNASHIDLAAVQWDSLTLDAIAKMPRTARTASLSDEDWDAFGAVLQVFYQKELPEKSATQFNNMRTVIRSMRAVAAQSVEKRVAALDAILAVMLKLATWLPGAVETGIVTDADIVNTVIGQTVAKAERMKAAEVPELLL